MTAARPLASACSIAQSIRSKNVGSIVYGGPAFACADHLIGIRTESKPAS